MPFKHKEQKIEWQRVNRDKNRSEYLAASRERHKKIKLDVVSHYSKGTNNCTCCGIEDMDVLTLDHINGGGSVHRKLHHQVLSEWLYANNHPEGFQVLCFNCNWKKHLSGEVLY